MSRYRIVVALAGISLALFAALAVLHPSWSLARTTDRLRQLGVTIEVRDGDDFGRSGRTWHDVDIPAGAGCEEVRELLSHLPRIVSIEVDASSTNMPELLVGVDFSELRYFGAHQPLSAAVYEQLSEAHHLEFLDLSRSGASDSDITDVVQLPHLQSVTLDDTRVQGRCFASIQNWAIEDLSLARCELDSQLGSHLRNCAALRWLDLPETHISNDLAAQLSQLKVKSINCQGATLSTEAAVELARAPTLTTLNLRCTTADCDIVRREGPPTLKIVRD